MIFKYTKALNKTSRGVHEPQKKETKINKSYGSVY